LKGISATSLTVSGARLRIDKGKITEDKIEKKEQVLSFKAGIYNVLIDPLLTGLKSSVGSLITEKSTVIDIACGTGSLALELAKIAEHVAGIDLDQDLISFARKKAAEKKISNVSFMIKDAADLCEYHDKEFSFAVTSMAVHQFEEKLAVQILSEMNRIADKVVIADYNYPLPQNMAGYLAWGIEKFAGGDHFRNFRSYMSRGGLDWFASAAGLQLRTRIVKGYGVFIAAGS
jgi:SAM-dependent methyltransferase